METSGNVVKDLLISGLKGKRKQLEHVEEFVERQQASLLESLQERIDLRQQVREIEEVLRQQYGDWESEEQKVAEIPEEIRNLLRAAGFRSQIAQANWWNEPLGPGDTALSSAVGVTPAALWVANRKNAVKSALRKAARTMTKRDYDEDD